MGLFSFLKRRREPAATVPQPVGPREAAATPPEPSGPPSFHAPEAWDFGSLTATPPPLEADGVLVGPADAVATAAIEPQVIAAISTVFDPEIPVNIYELGLIYGIRVDANARVGVTMTLTSPACPSAQQLPSEVRWKIKAVAGVTDAHVEVVWDPPWTKERMSEAARLSLGLF